jgi:hypothetical protein
MGAAIMAKGGSSVTALLVGIGVALGLSPPVAAQSQSDAEDGDYFRRDRNTSVAQRRQDRSDVGGLRAGAFLIRPELTVLGGYTDNYAAAEDNAEEGTAVYEVNGRLGIESDWGRHALNASLFVPTTIYDGEFSTTDYIATLGGRLDVDRSLNIDVGVGYADRGEPLGFSDPAITLREPLRYQTTTASIGVAKTFNRLRIAADAAIQDSGYQRARLADGTPVTFDERDVTTSNYGLRADFALSPTTSIFASASANERDHDLDPPDVPLNLDSEGTQYLVGVNFDITHAIRGEIGVGQLTQTYDDPAFEDQEGLSARGQIDWFPDELFTVSLGFQRAIGDSRDTAAATYVGTDVTLGADYEFRRNVNVGVRATHSTDEYNEIDREDTRWSVYGTVDYEINRTAALTFTAGHIEQSSDGVDDGRNYGANVGLIGIRLRR